MRVYSDGELLTTGCATITPTVHSRSYGCGRSALPELNMAASHNLARGRIPENILVVILNSNKAGSSPPWEKLVTRVVKISAV